MEGVSLPPVLCQSTICRCSKMPLCLFRAAY